MAAQWDELPDFEDMQPAPFPTPSGTPRDEWKPPSWFKPEYYDCPLYPYWTEKQIKSYLSRLNRKRTISETDKARNAANAKKAADKRWADMQAKTEGLRQAMERARMAAAIARDLGKPEWAILVLEADDAQRKLAAHMLRVEVAQRKRAESEFQPIERS